MVGKVSKGALASAVLTCLALPAPMEAQPAPSSVEGAQPVAALLATAPRAVLVRGPLRVELVPPDAAHGFYRGTRFDWSGMILAVQLGGAHFYGPWFDAVAPGVRDYVDEGGRIVTGPNTSATGPADEFQGENANPVPGYNDAAPGGTFIKIGVGRLRRADDRPYNRFNSYAIVDGGQWRIRRRADSMSFVQTLLPAADGYGYRYEKMVQLQADGSIIIRHSLHNTGRKPIITQVYSHNFMRFGERSVDQTITVQSPLLRGLAPRDPALASVAGDRLGFARSLARNESVAFPTAGSPPIIGQPVFQVHHADGGTIAAYTDSPITRALFWNIRKVNAVEPYIALNVAPGQQQVWTWRYSFSVRQDL